MSSASDVESLLFGDVGKDPEALAYFQAQKTMRATKAQSSSTLKHQHKSKRYPNPR